MLQRTLRASAPSRGFGESCLLLAAVPGVSLRHSPSLPRIVVEADHALGPLGGQGAEGGPTGLMPA